MPGRSPAAAVSAFIAPLQRSISCLSGTDVLIVSTGGRNIPGKIHSLTVASGDPVPLRGTDKALDVALQYDVIRTDEPGKGPFKVRTRAYDYAFRDRGGETLVSYHWHPIGLSTFTAPHWHEPRMFPRVHWPCERTSLESVIRTCIAELGAEPARDDWDQVLAENDGVFQLYRSWSKTPQLAREAETPR